MRQYAIGENCLCWELGDRIAPEISNRVLFLYRRLKTGRPEAFPILDVVPSYHTIAVHFDPADAAPKDIAAWVEEEIQNLPDRLPELSGKRHILPVRYNGSDLGFVAGHCGLSVSEVTHLHSTAAYRVAMIGFKPHFPYLLGLNPKLATPRRETPQTLVPAGSVAIGGAQTGIYPCPSPGGWHILGTTEPDLLLTIEPGDIVCFKPSGTGDRHASH